MLEKNVFFSLPKKQHIHRWQLSPRRRNFDRTSALFGVPSPVVGPEVFFSMGIFGGGKKAWPNNGERLHSSNFFFGGGMEMPNNCEQLEKVYFVFFPWWNSAGVDENPSNKKLWKNYTKSCQSYYLKLKYSKCSILGDFHFHCRFHFHFWCKFDFHFPWRWTSPLSTGETVKLESGWLASPPIPGTTTHARGDGRRRCRDQAATAGVDTEDGECTGTGSAEGWTKLWRGIGKAKYINLQSVCINECRLSYIYIYL